MSRLEESSGEYRDKLLAKSIYNANDEYNNAHSRAKSDGDVHGKGENDSSIGSSVDIDKRGKALASNKFTQNNPYGIANA